MTPLPEPGTLRTTGEFHMIVDDRCVDDGQIYRALLKFNNRSSVYLDSDQLGPSELARLQREYDEEMERQREEAEE